MTKSYQFAVDNSSKINKILSENQFGEASYFVEDESAFDLVLFAEPTDAARKLTLFDIGRVKLQFKRDLGLRVSLVTPGDYASMHQDQILKIAPITEPRVVSPADAVQKIDQMRQQRQAQIAQARIGAKP